MYGVTLEDRRLNYDRSHVAHVIHMEHAGTGLCSAGAPAAERSPQVGSNRKHCVPWDPHGLCWHRFQQCWASYHWKSCTLWALICGLRPTRGPIARCGKASLHPSTAVLPKGPKSPRPCGMLFYSSLCSINKAYQRCVLGLLFCQRCSHTLEPRMFSDT